MSSQVMATTAASATTTTTMGAAASQAAAASSASAAMKTLSSAIASASAALASEKAVAAGGGLSLPAWMKWLGLCFAVGSGVLIGSSFVFKKKGLLAAQKKYQVAAGESYAYLKSPMWWTGMIMMIFGEVLNLVAYAVTSAVLVTPLGALSVVICAILSSIFLKEKLTIFGKVGCFLCIVGSTIIALNGPSQHAAGQIKEFQKMFLSVGFLVWGGICIATSLGLFFFAVPRWGKKNMLIHISICSLIGGLSVSTISGVGSAIVLSVQGDNQFKYWFIYFLLAFVTVTLITEIIFLNKALELFNTAMVTPTYYVLFTFCTLVTSIILFQGLDSTPIQIVTIVLGFLTICAGICLLQLSKIDPEELTDKDGVNLDRSTTFLIRASQSHVSTEKGRASAVEDPGVDTVRGGLGVIGSLVRARSSRRFRASADEYRRMADEQGGMHTLCTNGKDDLERFELHDRPMPKSPVMGQRGHLAFPQMPFGMPQKRDTTISFVSGSEDPHGHHLRKDTGASRDSVSPSSNANSTNPTNSSNRYHAAPIAGGILMTSTTSNNGEDRTVFHDEPAQYTQRGEGATAEDVERQKSIRLIGPRVQPRTASRNEAVWTNEGGAAAAADESRDTFDNSLAGYGDETTRDFNDDDDEDDVEGSSSASSQATSKRSGRVFAIARGKSSQGAKGNRVEVEELLSPVMRDELESGGGAFPTKRR